MDITLFENARSLTALYKNIPQLQDVEIIKLIVVPGEDLELILTLDTSELPEKLPLKWLDPKVNTVQIELDFIGAVSYTHLRAHETVLDLVCRLLLEKKKK